MGRRGRQRSNPLTRMPQASAFPPHTPFRVRGEMPVDELVRRLKEAKGRHARADRWRSLATFGRLLLVVACSLGAVGFAMEYMGLWSLAAMTLLPIPIVVLAIRQTAAGNPDYDGQRALAVGRAFEALAPELAAGSTVDVDVQLRGYPTGRRRVLERTGIGFPKVVLYEQDWLRATLRLLDGSTVTLHASTVAKRKQRVTSKWFKKKDRVKDVLRVSVRPKGAVPGEDAPARAAAGAEAVDGLRLRGAKRRPRALDLVFETGLLSRYTQQGTWRVQSSSALLTGHRLLMAIVVGFSAAKPRAPG